MRNRKRGRNAASAHYIMIGLLGVCAALILSLIIVLLTGRHSDEESARESEENIAESVIQETETEGTTEPDAASNEEADEEETDPFAQRDSDKLYVHFIDIGQGDATLFLQGDHAMLVDTGSASSTAAASTRDLIAYLDALDVKKLDYLVLTHGHEDHVGRAIDVMSSCEIGHLVEDFGNAEGYVTNTMDRAEHLGLDIIKPKAGDEFPLGDAKILVLTGRETSIPSTGNETTDVNNQSIGLRVTFGEISFLLYGDGEAEYEKYLLSQNVKLKSDVLKVPHHGYESSLSDEMLEKVHPKFAVISSAKKSNFGFPSDATLEKLGRSEVATFCTNRLGNIVAETNGTELTWSINDQGK